MNANRHHANRPTRYTNADHMRMRAADDAHARRIAAQRTRARLCAAAYCLGIVILAIVMYRSI